MNAAVIGGLIRHALTVAGGYFAGTGIVSTEQVDTGVGAIMILAGIAWSVYRKYAE